MLAHRARAHSRYRHARVGALVAVVGLVGVYYSTTGVETASAAAGLVPDAVRTDLPVVVDGVVTDIEQVGNRIVVAGTFTQVQPTAGAAPIDQAYIYAYDIDTGAFDANFRPTLNQDLEQIAPAPDGSGIYLVGRFSNIDGVTVRKVAKLNADGSLDPNFVANADAKATAVAVSPDGQRVFVGGVFTTINGEPRQGLAELDAATGAVDGGFTIAVEGGIGVGGAISVKGLAVTPDGRSLIVMAPAKFIGGEERFGLAKISLQGDVATLQKWRTRLFEDNLARAGGQFWLRGFDLSPDGTYFVVTTSGGDRPPTNDVAIRFPVRGNGSDDVVPDWITRNFDSTYSVAIDDDVVYMGGHFQYTEAPGAIDPYQGDPDRSYGFGGDVDASVLGDKTIARQQVAALDPGTGQALGWNPGANGFNGVYALQVIDRGLLLGNDGDVVGDKPVGRHGFFDRNHLDAPDEPGLADTTISSPLTGQQFDVGAPAEMAGTASAAGGVARVQVTVYNLGSKQWLRPDGSWGEWAGLAATIDAGVGATTSGWSFALPTVGAGHFEVKARTFAGDGSKDEGSPSLRYVVNPPTVDERPNTTLLSSTVAEAGNVLNFAGTATDDRGVAGVRIEVVNLDNGTYLQADGSVGNYYAFAAEVDNPGATGINFTFGVTVPNGWWRVYFIAVDSAGQRDTSAAGATRRVALGDEPPTLVQVDQPIDAAVIASLTPFTVTGLASDDIGIKQVLVQVVNLATNQGLLTNGQIAPIDGLVRSIPATLNTADAPTTAWSLQVPGLPPGRYRINASATDASKQAIGVNRYFEVRAEGNALPQVWNTSPAAGAVADPQIDALGRATDDGGVSRVEVAWYAYAGDGRQAGYLRPDGTLGSIPSWTDAALSEPGATSTNWTTTVTLPHEGRWQVRSRAWDATGQPSPLIRITILDFRPGDAAPTIEVDHLADGAWVAAGPLRLNGVIRDDANVSRVRVYVRRTFFNEVPNPDPDLTTANWFDAFVTQPGGVRSNFAFTSLPLEPGPWFAYVEGFDATGQVSERLRINFTVGSANNPAPVAAVSAPANGSIDTPTSRLVATGSATDNAGVARVDVVVYDHQQRGFLLPNCSVTNEAATAYRTTTLTTPGKPTTNWQTVIELPGEGQYNLYAIAYDNQGMRQTAHRWGGSFSTFWFAPGDARPAITIASPQPNTTVDDLVVAGTASDDVGVSRVQILVRYADDLTKGLRPDGTLSSTGQWLDVVSAAPGVTSTQWSFAEDLPPGRYHLVARVMDSSGKWVNSAAVVVTVR